MLKELVLRISKADRSMYSYCLQQRHLDRERSFSKLHTRQAYIWEFAASRFVEIYIEIRLSGPIAGVLVARKKLLFLAEADGFGT